MIICSNEEEEKSYLISKLHLYKRQFVHIPETDRLEFKKYLTNHFIKKHSRNVASAVDFQGYGFFVNTVMHGSQITGRRFS